MLRCLRLPLEQVEDCGCKMWSNTLHVVIVVDGGGDSDVVSDVARSSCCKIISIN
jgi:hypothetical protein